jgi:hypothetical protein
MRRLRLSLLWLITAALLAACEQETASASFGGEARGVVGEDAVTNGSGVTLVDMEASADDLPPLLVRWTDGDDMAAKSAFSFTVTNTTLNEIAFTPSVFADGPIGSAEKAFDGTALAPDESASFSVNAAELPIRSSAVVNIVSVKLARVLEQPDGEHAVSSLVASRYVRHEPGFDKARAYTEEQFKTDLGGVLVSRPFSPKSYSATDVAAALASESIGEVLGEDGVFHAKSLGASDMAVRNAADEVVAIVTEVRHGAPDEAEMEVDDE